MMPEVEATNKCLSKQLIDSDVRRTKYRWEFVQFQLAVIYLKTIIKVKRFKQKLVMVCLILKIIYNTLESQKTLNQQHAINQKASISCIIS